MKALREAVVLVGLALAGGAATHFLHPRAPAWREVEEPLRDDEVTLEAVSRRWKGEVLWIDARPRSRFEQGHIPGAINLSEQELEVQLADHIMVLQDNRRPVVVYCDSGACQASRRIKEYLSQRLPLEEFHVLRGGWPAWVAAGPRGK